MRQRRRHASERRRDGRQRRVGGVQRHLRGRAAARRRGRADQAGVPESDAGARSSDILMKTARDVTTGNCNPRARRCRGGRRTGHSRPATAWSMRTRRCMLAKVRCLGPITPITDRPDPAADRAGAAGHAGARRSADHADQPVRPADQPISRSNRCNRSADAADPPISRSRRSSDPARSAGRERRRIRRRPQPQRPRPPRRRARRRCRPTTCGARRDDHAIGNRSRADRARERRGHEKSAARQHAVRGAGAARRWAQPAQGAGSPRRGVACDVRYLDVRIRRALGARRVQWMHVASCRIHRLRRRLAVHRALYGPTPGRRCAHIVDEMLRDDLAPRRGGRSTASCTCARCVEHFLDHCLAAVPGRLRRRRLHLDLRAEHRLARAGPAHQGGAPGDRDRVRRRELGRRDGHELHRQFGFVDYVCSGEADEQLPRARPPRAGPPSGRRHRWRRYRDSSIAIDGADRSSTGPPRRFATWTPCRSRISPTTFATRSTSRGRSRSFRRCCSRRRAAAGGERSPTAPSAG